MLSLKERIEMLEHDLSATPMRIGVYRGLPFAILRYEPEKEWQIRREARLLATRLEEAGREVVFISFADLLWEALEECEGLKAVVRQEHESGFAVAQAQITKYFSDKDWIPLEVLLARHLQTLDPRRHIAFLVRAAAMAPALFFMSTLIDRMQNRTEVPCVLFYPGSKEGENQLRFMDIKGRDALGTYRAKIYG